VVYSSREAIAWRINRFARLRCTAPPIALLADSPTLVRELWLGKTTKITSGWAYDLPWRRTRIKSADCVRRNSRFTGFGELTVPVGLFDVIVHAHGELMAAFRPTAFKDVPPPSGRHPAAEPVHPQTTSDLGLVCSFWHGLSFTRYILNNCRNTEGRLYH